jgi:hypothetical protein
MHSVHLHIEIQYGSLQIRFNAYVNSLKLNGLA